MPFIASLGAAAARAFGFAQNLVAQLVDPFFNYVSLLLSGNGINGAQNNTFLDSSSNNFTITRNGNTTQGSFSPFGDTWSNYFDGNGDFLSVAHNTALDLSSGNFTLEAYVYSLNSEGAIVNKDGVQNQFFPSYAVGLSPASGLVFTIGNANTSTTFQQVVSGVSFPTNQWVHVAVVKNGTSLLVFQNGVLVASATQNITIVDAGRALLVGYQTNSAVVDYFDGYISNLRILKGTALYTANFIPPTAPLMAITNTSLLTCQSNRFIDNSTNNFAITVNGNTSVQKFSPFLPNPNTWSVYFDGTNDSITTPSNSAFDFGTGDFTVEFWAYSQNSSGYTALIGTSTADTASTIRWRVYVETDNLLTADIYSTANTNIGFVKFQSTFPRNQWVHCALVRSGTTFRIYQDGVQSTNSITSSAAVANNVTAVRIADFDASVINDLNGYISNARIVKGTAVYTTSFTPPTAPLTAISGTSLLTCQNSTIKDNSPNMFPLTVVGNAAPNTLSPFLGFSGYFDGVGDYLATPSNAALSVGTGAFTYECFVCFQSLPAGVSGIAGQIAESDTSGNHSINFYTNGSSLNITIQNNSAAVFSATASVSIGQWYHLLLVRNSSGTTSAYVNGTRLLTASNTTDIVKTSFVVGRVYTASDSFYGNAYISNLRLVKGTAVYDPALTTITVPPVPVLPITNTSLLLNFANAGIQDVAMINDIETVGNAQVSTTQSKFGGSSFFFDGTGDYLLSPHNPDLNFGTGDFTIEMWAYFNTTANNPMLFAKATQNSSPKGWFFEAGSSSLFFGYGDQSGQFVQFTVPAFSNGVWYHLAATRVGATLRVFVNGVMFSSTLTGADTAYDRPTAPLAIGSYVTVNGSTALDLNGYLDELRITKGIARYTTNFTPPTAPFLTY